MKALRAAIIVAVIFGVSAPSLAAIYFNDFACTRQTWVGRSGLYTSDSNYSTRYFGRVARGETETSIMDFDRAGMLNWVRGIYNTCNGASVGNAYMIGNGAVRMTMYLTAYDAWEDSVARPPTIFGHYFWPGVRLSQSGDWLESEATFNNAAIEAPWHDAAGNTLANLYVNQHNTTANMILNAASEPWGAADTLGGGADVYAYDTPRPWVLDDSVAYAALKNLNVVCFSLVADIYNKPWTSANGGVDDCTGTIYGRLHDSTAYRPFVEVQINTSRIPGPPYYHTGYPGDFNNDEKVDFKDYLILEANFGKSGMTNAQGDANGDGKVSFADYVLLEQEFGHTSTPEPATVGLLIAGALAMLRRRRGGKTNRAQSDA